MEFPDFVKEQMKELADDFNMDKEKRREMIKRYKEIFNDSFIQDEEEFESDRDRHAYAIRLLKVEMYSEKPSGKEIEVVPIGYKETRETKKGERMSTIFAGRDGEIVKIVCKNEQAALWEEVDLFSKYKTNVREYQGTFFATENTEFTEPEALTKQPYHFLTENVEVQKITIKEAPDYRSAREGNFTDLTDWRLIEGIILEEPITGENSNGKEYALYRLGDESSASKPKAVDGEIIPRQLTVWVQPSQQLYSEMSEVAVAGTITPEANPPEMRSYCVIPIHAKGLMEE